MLATHSVNFEVCYCDRSRMALLLRWRIPNVVEIEWLTTSPDIRISPMRSRFVSSAPAVPLKRSQHRLTLMGLGGTACATLRFIRHPPYWFHLMLSSDPSLTSLGPLY